MCAHVPSDNLPAKMLIQRRGQVSLHHLFPKSKEETPQFLAKAQLLAPAASNITPFVSLLEIKADSNPLSYEGSQMSRWREDNPPSEVTRASLG